MPLVNITAEMEAHYQVYPWQRQKWVIPTKYRLLKEGEIIEGDDRYYWDETVKDFRHAIRLHARGDIGKPYNFNYVPIYRLAFTPKGNKNVETIKNW